MQGRQRPIQRAKTRILRGTWVTTFLVLCTTAAGTALAQSNNYVYGEVLEADPIIEIVREPVEHEVCYPPSKASQGTSKTPLIAGGIIGGLLGHQFGSGRGRVATSIAGAALGASVGADHARKRREASSDLRCDITKKYREYERVAGYRVKYRYDGQIHTTETKTHPGDQIRLELTTAAS